MKENWTYKKLGEVCEIICGQDYKSIQDDNGLFPIYGTGGIMGRASQYRCPANSVIIGRKGNINNPLFVEEPFWNVDTAFGVVPKENILFPKFFYFFCKNYDFTKHDVSVTIPSLRRTDIMKIDVPVPPISEQSRIVSELDLLQSIIDKQQAQLKELDKLAQAVFYDMFGDPVENEKGWEVKPLYVLCSSICGGGTPSKSISSYWEGGDIPWVTSKDMKVTYVGDSQMYITKEGSDNSSAKILPANSILMVLRSGILKHTLPVAITTREVSINQDLKAFILKKDIVVPLFFLYQIKAYSKFLLRKVRAVTADNIEFSNVKNLNLVLPPLPLQHSFATKIESIEKQKAAISQSIAETQKLFDYTMDKYFG